LIRVDTTVIAHAAASRYNKRSSNYGGALLSSYVPGDLLDHAFDDQFLRALRDRDPGAEGRLVSTFSVPVRCKLRGLLRSPELIQDASQETFLRVLRYFQIGKTLDNPANLPGFVLTVCRNTGLEYLRAYTRHDQIPPDMPEQADERNSPEEGAVEGERREMVRRILADLREKDRNLLRRVFLEEEDKDRVCADLNVTRDYLRVLLHRARLRLRSEIERGASAGKGATG
jgi:RNA polymerase sigma-70 factor (ECF subfamily)